ncbi:CidA/LrgA family protein [Gluconacetobacter takamatsuzukensis]|uniref:CidA/LrgA family protein n=1 Tax=Gluconacetobacter takamatsuzukensis TaxID=1286190 RepID=A0A7W4PPJ6_9PROT|nr:CidA/LrgA family protein [Gluconacetobacter takamatsuzukensis]MBB2205495.1 CidA/LrgA family protein [Gluconacetobacter takamatsuzukensis]
MPSAMLVLVGCQLVGELLRATFQVPIPGPVIGMFLLALVLGIRAKRTGTGRTPAPLKPVAEGLIANMGLLFVPAGVGIIAEAGVIRKEWLPIVVAVAGSTILSLIVTALVMHWTLRPAHADGADHEGGVS